VTAFRPLPQLPSARRERREGNRPRELLEQRGAELLSDAALLALIFRTGTAAPSRSALDLGRSLLDGMRLARWIAPRCATLRDAGPRPAKVASLKAALEVRRRLLAGAARIGPASPAAARWRALHPRLFNLTKEVFLAYFSRRNEIMRRSRSPWGV